MVQHCRAYWLVATLASHEDPVNQIRWMVLLRDFQVLRRVARDQIRCASRWTWELSPIPSGILGVGRRRMIPGETKLRRDTQRGVSFVAA